MKRKATIAGLIILALVAMGTVGQILIGQRGTFVAQTDLIVFERDIREDGGIALTSNTATSVNGVKMKDVFSEVNKNRFGADGEQPDGVGLVATFRVKRGTTIVSEEKFVLAQWDSFEPESLPARRTLVGIKKEEFDKMAAQYMAPVSIPSYMAIVIDTTEGVDSRLGVAAQDMASDNVTAGKTNLFVYRLSEMAYQGDRLRLKPAKSLPDAVNAVDTVLGSRKAEANSSVYRGLRSILADLNANRKGEPIRVEIWTDGLENTDELSVYKDPGLLDEANWAKLDVGWGIGNEPDFSSMSADGMEIHLHPLPPKPGDRVYERRMELGSAYLKSRLTVAGAKVTIEAI